MALAFGKDEGGGYEFTQELVGSVVQLQIMSYMRFTYPTALRSVLHLCISGKSQVHYVNQLVALELACATVDCVGCN